MGNAASNAADWSKTKLIVTWGSNCEASGANQAKPKGIVNALNKGCKLIDIRPMLDPLAAKADMWLPIRPGTDAALALTILHVIIGENLYDHEFVSQWCHGFDKLAEYVKEFTPEWAAEKTGLPAEQILEAARMIGTIKPMVLNQGNGCGDQARDGTAQSSAQRLIQAITGNLDIPGGGGSTQPMPQLIELRWEGEYGGINRFPERADPALVDKLVKPMWPKWYQQPGNWKVASQKTLMTTITKDPYPVRVVIAQHTDPLTNLRQPKKISKAL